MFFLPVTLAALCLLSSASAQCSTENADPPNVKEKVIAAQFDFALDTLKKIVQIEPKDNIFYSPHSLQQALTLVYFGARGTTEESLKKALHIPNDMPKYALQRYYSVYDPSKQQDIVQNNAQADYEYKTANRLWISNTRKVRECMLDLFSDQLEKTDFRTNPSAVKDHINEWVSNMTKGHIRDLLSADSIAENTDLVLANAVYFKGLWLSRFDVANSKNDLFYTSDSRHSMTTFMKQEGNFNHDAVNLDTLGAYVLELPYKGENVSMFILLPPYAVNSNGDSKNRDSVRLLIERISTKDGSAKLREIFKSDMSSQQVEVIIPRFEMERELALGTLLHALGAGELMMPNKADLRDFLEEGEPPLSLGDAVHRAKIEVTEEGTTAAAATALYSFRSGRPLGPTVFKADHPFLYFIYDKALQTILFTGVFRSPGNPQNNA